MHGNLAAIDLGTNSCRLLITDPEGNVLVRESDTVKLGEGLYHKRSFSEDAMKRTFECLAKFSEEMVNYDALHYRAVATAACRMAENGEKFVEKVHKLCNIKLEIIDANEEALLNVKGAKLNVHASVPYFVTYDVGGGSTEITMATNTKNPEIIYTVSVPWGARNAAEAFDLAEYNSANANKLQAEVNKYTQDFLLNSEYLMHKNECDCIATSSTVLRLLSMVYNTAGYDRHQVDGATANIAQLDEQVEKIWQMKLMELEQNKYIGANRAPIIVAATIIFKQIYDDLRMNTLTASLKGALEAMIEDLVKKQWQN